MTFSISEELGRALIVRSSVLAISDIRVGAVFCSIALDSKVVRCIKYRCSLIIRDACII